MLELTASLTATQRSGDDYACWRGAAQWIRRSALIGGWCLSSFAAIAGTDAVAQQFPGLSMSPLPQAAPQPPPSEPAPGKGQGETQTQT